MKKGPQTTTPLATVTATRTAHDPALDALLTAEPVVFKAGSVVTDPPAPDPKNFSLDSIYKLLDDRMFARSPDDDWELAANVRVNRRQDVKRAHPAAANATRPTAPLRWASTSANTAHTHNIVIAERVVQGRQNAARYAAKSSGQLLRNLKAANVVIVDQKTKAAVTTRPASSPPSWSTGALMSSIGASAIVAAQQATRSSSPSKKIATIVMDGQAAANGVGSPLLHTATVPEPSSPRLTALAQHCLFDMGDENGDDALREVVEDDDDVDEERRKVSQLRGHALLLIGEHIDEMCRQDSLKERGLVSAVRELQESVRVNEAVVLNLRRNRASSVVQHARIITSTRANAAPAPRRVRQSISVDDVLVKVDLAKTLIAKTIAQLFLVKLQHITRTRAYRRELIARLQQRAPRMSMRLIFRTWAQHASTCGQFLRDMQAHAAPVHDIVNKRIITEHLSIWRHRSLAKRVHACRCKIARSYNRSKFFFLWRHLLHRRFHMRQQLHRALIGHPSTAYTADHLHREWISSFRTRCSLATRNASPISTMPGRPARFPFNSVAMPSGTVVPGLLRFDQDLGEERLFALAQCIHDRSISRAALSQWQSRLFSAQLAHHVDALGAFRRKQRAVRQWRQRVGQQVWASDQGEAMLHERLVGKAMRHWMTVKAGRCQTRTLIRDVVYPRRLQARLLQRWRRKAHWTASVGRWRRKHNLVSMSSCIQHWVERAALRVRLRRALNRFTLAHLVVEWRGLWFRWRDRVSQQRLLQHVFRLAIERWSARLAPPEPANEFLVQVRTFTAWHGIACRARAQRVHRVQINTADIFAAIRLRLWVLTSWSRVVRERRVFRAWRQCVRESAHALNCFVIKWRYLVPLKRCLKVMRTRTVPSREQLAWRSYPH